MFPHPSAHTLYVNKWIRVFKVFKNVKSKDIQVSSIQSKIWQLDRILIPLYFVLIIDIFLNYVPVGGWMGRCGFGHVSAVPSEVRGGCWSYRCFWTTLLGCWELNSSGRAASEPTEPSLQLLYLVFYITNSANMPNAQNSNIKQIQEKPVQRSFDFLFKNVPESFMYLLACILHVEYIGM